MWTETTSLGNIANEVKSNFITRAFTSCIRDPSIKGRWELDSTWIWQQYKLLNFFGALQMPSVDITIAFKPWDLVAMQHEQEALTFLVIGSQHMIKFNEFLKV